MQFSHLLYRDSEIRYTTRLGRKFKQGTADCLQGLIVSRLLALATATSCFQDKALAKFWGSTCQSSQYSQKAPREGLHRFGSFCTHSPPTSPLQTHADFLNKTRHQQPTPPRRNISAWHRANSSTDRTTALVLFHTLGARRKVHKIGTSWEPRGKYRGHRKRPAASTKSRGNKLVLCGVWPGKQSSVWFHLVEDISSATLLFQCLQITARTLKTEAANTVLCHVYWHKWVSDIPMDPFRCSRRSKIISFKKPMVKDCPQGFVTVAVFIPSNFSAMLWQQRS